MPASRSAAAQQSPPLHALSAVVARLALGDRLDAAIPAALRTLQSSLDAAEVAVWLAAPGGLERAWSAGERLVTAPLLDAMLDKPDAPREDVRVARIGVGERRVGILVVVLRGAIDPDGDTLIEAVANTLGPAIRHEEQQHELETEVGSRTRQLDDERRFTERIIDSLPVGLYVIDREYRIRAWNLVGRTLFLLQHHARFKQLSVRTDLDTAMDVLREASREQLLQVIMALLLNAMDATTGAGEIVIRTRTGSVKGEEVILEVIDGGAGIPRSEVPKIFEPFYTTKPAGSGTGLGLSICYGIVTDHGGRIDVDSTPGKGSTFRVILPAARS